ncbi:hypothetical protein [Marinicella sp. W31]|uniref:hypothetical protein n=1 Tax=Marinicella sp. W31 TaxID=3023713 RepID=UPI003756AB11
MMRFWVFIGFFLLSVSAAEEPLLKVQLSAYHPLATKEHLLKRLLPEQYHTQFIKDKKWHKDQLDEFSVDLAQESYSLYLPQPFDPQNTYGLIIWIHPDESGKPNRGWMKVFDDLKLIYISANRSGNQHSVTARRAPLALHALHNLQQQYQIDPDRIYLAGFSGGGFTSSHLAMGYGDLISGAYYMSGADPVGGQRVPMPSENRLEKIKKQGRYVFYAGKKEPKFMRAVSRAYRSYEELGIENIHFLKNSKAGHDYVNASWMRKGLELLDQGLPEKSTEN